jgi:galactokinase
MRIAMAPGRVNLLGEYTDLNDGYVLPMTIDCGVYVALRKREDSMVHLYSVLYDDTIEYRLDRYPAPRTGSWSSYVCGVIEELRLLGLLEQGFEGVVDGDLPLGSGLSSSAALEVATAISLQQLIGFALDPVEMARLCQHVEHRYANVQCGIMDQFASRVGRENHALFLDCRSLNYEIIPLATGDYRVVIISTGMERSLANSAYNIRRAECEEATEYFRQLDANVVALRDVSADLFAEHGEQLPDNVRRRCRHVIAENQRVLDAVTLLSNGELIQFGVLMNASHDSLRDDFEVSCAELDFLNTLARNADGVLGARMTGAGFGGCTVNLVHKEAISGLEEQLNADYASRFNLTPTVFVLQGNLEAGPVPTAA